MISSVLVTGNPDGPGSHDEQRPSNLTSLSFGIETDIWGVNSSGDTSKKEIVVVGICSKRWNDFEKITCFEIYCDWELG